jgi:hypothetical protein
MQGDETDGTAMEASIKYEIDGREVSREQFLRAMLNNFHRMVQMCYHVTVSYL